MRLKPRQFIRMARWARKPPSDKRVKLVLFVLLAALSIWGLEKVFGTPDWMRINDAPRGRINR